MACVDITSNGDLLITQYNASPKLHAIVDGLNAVVQTEQLNPLCLFEKGMALDYATGWLLDRIGHNHGLNRPVVRLAAGKYFGFEQGGLNYDRAPFFFGIKDRLLSLGDVAYRKLLRVWIMGLFYDGSTYGLTKILTEALRDINGEGGGYALDHENKKVTVYIFDEDVVTFRALSELQIIPKAVGINYEYVAISKKDIELVFGNVPFGVGGFAPSENSHNE